MRNPQKILTEDGLLRYQASLVNLEDSAFYIANHGDDLLLDDDVMATLHKVDEVCMKLKKQKEFEE